MSVKIRRVSRFDELQTLRGNWNAIAADTPFSTWQWLHTWAESFIREDDLYTLVAESESHELLGILPLYRSWSMIEGRVLRWLGSGSVCTDHLTLFSAPDFSSTVSQEMTRWLVAAANDHALGWDSMLLDHVSPEDDRLAEFCRSLQSQGCDLVSSSSANCWQLALPQSWEEYLASLSKSHRKQVRRCTREFLDNGRAKLRTVEDANHLNQSLETLVYLHQKRRNHLGQPGCFACDRFTSFLYEASEKLLAAGMLRLHTLEIAGRAAAAEWQLTDGKTTFAYQAGIDPNFLEFEPGRLITIATLQRAIAAGQRAFDFLRGDEPYKAHFRAMPQAKTSWRCVAPTRRAQSHNALSSAGRTLKRWLKTAVGASSSHEQRSLAPSSEQAGDNSNKRTDVSVDKITAFDELSAYRKTWNELAANTSQAQFFQTYDWFATYWKHYGEQQRLQTLIVRDGDRVIGIVPLVIRVEQRRLGRLRVLTFPLDDWGSHYGPITADPLTTTSAAIDYLAKQPKPWDILSWRWLAPDSKSEAAITQAMAQARLKTMPATRATTALIDLPSDWEQYLASRNSKFRNNLRRWQRRVEELGTLRFQKFRPPTGDAAGADPRWDLYDTCVQLASKSWQGSSTSGTTLSHAAIRSFLREMHHTAVVAGAADLNLMYLNERPVAFEYGYWWCGYKYCLRFGYDNDICQSGLGNVMWLQTINASIKAGDHSFDMGPGSMDYKRFFITRECECRTLDHYRRFAPKAQAIAWKHAVDQWRHLG